MAKFKIPADLSTLDSAELSASVEEALAAFGEFSETPDAELTDEQVSEMSALHGFAKGANAELSAREEASAARSAELAAMREEMAGKPNDAEDEQEAPETPGEKPDAEDIAEGEEPKPKAKPFASEPKGSFAARAARNAPKAAAPKGTGRTSGSLVASANVSGFAAGQKFNDFADASEVILSQLRALPSDGRGGRFRNTALIIETPDNQFTQSTQDMSEMLMEASNEARLPGGSLVAAGGWGAPSEHTLDFCKLENLDGLISLPEVKITRGGLQWTKGPTFADVNGSSNGFWDMDEATTEAGVVQKTFLRPSVPTFTERRLDAVGIGMEAGLLLRQGWPELVQRYADLLGTAHTLKLAQKKIAMIEAYTGAAVNLTNGFGNAMDLVHMVELVAIGERQKYAMSTKATLEALIPHWAKAVIRVDLAQRTGVDTLSVTDAQIDSYFTARGVKVQWLNAYQDIALDGTSGMAQTYPDTIEVIMYPAGTYVVGTAPVIKLDTIYDSALLAANDYIHLFMEQGILMTNPCGNGRRFSLPFLANGRRAGVTDAAVTAGQNDSFLNAPVANA
jgi:hypothetical protein